MSFRDRGSLFGRNLLDLRRGACRAKRTGMHDTHDEERPSVRRLPVSGVHVAITVDSETEHNLWSDLTLDVMNGGVFVATYHPMPVGTPVHILLSLEGEPVPLALTGVVAWTRPHREGSDGVAGAGIRFTDLEPRSAEKLLRFVESVRTPMVFELPSIRPAARR
jgi:uncharacterized protein (TIGR02266 family)